MKNINIFDILNKEMIIGAFSGYSGILDLLERDLKRDHMKTNWNIIKDNNIWFAELVQRCENFLRENCSEVYNNLLPQHVYNISYSKIKPEVDLNYFLQLDISIEDEKGEEEVISEQVNGKVVFHFGTNDGDLIHITAHEELTGEEWELWPDLEDFTDEIIYIDKDQADAEGIG